MPNIINYFMLPNYAFHCTLYFLQILICLMSAQMARNILPFIYIFKTQIFLGQFYNVIVLINKLTKVSGNIGNSIFKMIDNGFVLTKFYWKVFDNRNMFVSCSDLPRLSLYRHSTGINSSKMKIHFYFLILGM